MAEPMLARTTDSVMEFDIDDTISLYRSGVEQVVVLNAPAREVWKLLSSPISRDDLVGRLAALYCVDPGTIQQSLDDTVTTLVAEGLVATDL